MPDVLRPVLRPVLRDVLGRPLTPIKGGGWWLSGSELDLDFANNRAFNRSTGFNGSPNGILTYTSPSQKLVYGDDGVLGYAPHNLVQYSSQFDNAYWTKSSTTISSNAAIAPDGSLTADLMYPSTSGNDRRVIRVVPFSAPRGTVSVYAKAAGFSWIYIANPQANSSADTAYFNLGTGVVGTVGANCTATIESVGNGWYRCSVTGPADGTDVALVATADADNTVVSTANGTNGVYLWGAQASNGATLFDYIPTTSAAVYSLPIDHDPITHAPLGVLIEEQRTNLLLRSEQLASTWLTSGGTVASDAQTAPNGTLTADTITTAGGRNGIYQSVTVANGVAHTWSVYLKSISGPTKVWIGTESTPAASVNFDLSTGLFTNADVGLTNYSAVQLSNGWWRVQGTYTTASVSDVFVLYTNDAGATVIAAWGAQLEAGAFATSYIPTVASQVTRARDDISILTSAFAYNAAAGTVAYEADSGAGGALAFVYEFSDGTSSERILSNGKAANHLYVVDGASVVDLDAGTFVTGVLAKASQAFEVNNFAACINGGAVATSGAGTMPTVNILRFGRQWDTAWNLNGHIKRLTYFSTRKTDAELQALSA